LILVVLLLLFIAWNGLRSLQYRRAVAQGAPFPPPRPATCPEPAARRLLRITFAALWVLDGLLQLQQDMPLRLPSDVLRPAASTSPEWVQRLVGFGVDVWTRHPTSAAASSVWIQLGIGMFLLVAPRGSWSRLAGLTSVAWGLIVWVFGEAFGGLFAPGFTILFGAPGGVLLYVIAGVLVALPDRAWAGQRLGRVITTAAGGFLLVMAVLQAWPGRGFWQGGTPRKAGTLAGMVRQMAMTPQPHFLSSAVASFASFDEAHGWGVNLFVVVALAVSGFALLSGRRRLLSPTMIALIVLGLADWVLIEDFGVFGGTGTDPNSILPMLFVLGAGYVAIVRAPDPASVPVHDEVAAAGDGTTVRRAWERLDSGYVGRLAAALGAIVVVLVGTAPMVAASVNSRTDVDVSEAANGVPQATSSPAPDFHLVNQRGQPVSLASLRGYTVAMTFLDPVCTTDCPVIAQEFKEANHLLGAAAGKVRFVAIAANPQYHSVTALDDFDRQEGLSSQPNWLYLTGAMTIHADLSYVINADGVTRWIIPSDPGSGSADHASFSNLLVSEIEQVMRS
jgi:cytochrome oxidase Cu insertion factor (SCO1/SenC/PrrC family)